MPRPGITIITSTPHPYAGGMLRELARREQQARMEDFAAEVLYLTGLVCPFRAQVTWLPETEWYVVRAAGTELARMGSEEARRCVNASHAATILGLRARDGYAALEPLPHRHPLGQD